MLAPAFESRVRAPTVTDTPAPPRMPRTHSQKSLPGRPLSSGSVEEHTMFSNYIRPSSAGSSSNSTSATHAARQKEGKRRAGTVSDGGHGNFMAAEDAPEVPPVQHPAARPGSGSLFSTFHRSLSLDLSSGTKVRRRSQTTSPKPMLQLVEPVRRPSSPLSAEPTSNEPSSPTYPPRQSSPPPSSYIRHIPFGAVAGSSSSLPSPTTAAPVSREPSDEYTDREASSSASADVLPLAARSSSRTPRRSRGGSASSTGAGPSLQPPPRSRTGSRSQRPSPTSATSDEGAAFIRGHRRDGSNDVELARLAQTARRTERRISRGGRGEAESDPGHGVAPSGGRARSGTERRSRHGSGSGSRTRPRRHRSGSGTPGGESPSGRPNPPLVLRNA